MNDAEIRLAVKLDDSKAKNTIDTLQSKTDKLQQSFSNAGKKLTIGLTVPITGLIASGIKYNSTVEGLATSFEVMTGSAKESTKIIKQIKDIASKTPFEFTGLADTVQLLMNYGMTADEAISRMQMLGDISQGSAEKMNRIGMAYGQMSSAGKVSLEDVKQMIEAGFNPLNEISKTTGESMSSLYDRISKGTISVDEITASMQRSTAEGGKYFGSMDKQSETTAGKWSTLKDGFAEATGTLTTSLIPAIQGAITKLTEFANWFSNLDEKQKATILTILGLVAALGPLTMILGSVIGLVSALSLASITLGIGMLPLVLIIGGIILIIGGLIFAIGYAIGHWKAFSTGFIAIAKNIGLTIGVIFKGIVNTIIGAINVVTRVLNGFFAGILAPFNAIIWGLNKIPGVNLPTLKLSIPKIPMLETGTNYTSEGLHYLHDGEAVVPKKYNPSAGGIGMGQNIIVQSPDIYLDGEKVGKSITPTVSRTLRLAGAFR